MRHRGPAKIANLSQLIQEEKTRRCLTLQDRRLFEQGQLQLNFLPLRKSTALQFIRRPHRSLLAGIFLGMFTLPESVTWIRPLTLVVVISLYTRNKTESTALTPSILMPRKPA